MEKKNVGKRTIERAIRKYIISKDNTISKRALCEARAGSRLYYETPTEFICSMVNSLLYNDDPCIRRKAAVISNRIVSEQWLDAIVKALGDDDKTVRHLVTNSLEIFAFHNTMPEDFSFTATIGLVLATGDQDLEIHMDALRCLSYLSSSTVRLAIDRVLAKYGTDAPASES